MAEDNQHLEQLSDQDLVWRCIQRPVDQEAWEVFYYRFHAMVRRRVRKVLGWYEGETEDVVQEFFVAIFQDLGKYDRSRGPVTAFISKVISSTAIDYYRHGAALRSHMASSQDVLEILQIRASQDPQILGNLLEQIVYRLADKSDVPLIADLLYGNDVKDICAERGLKQWRVYAALKWLKATVDEILPGLPSY
jgi:RNA polymerase sigma factor (sigma-70 family)